MTCNLPHKMVVVVCGVEQLRDIDHIEMGDGLSRPIPVHAKNEQLHFTMDGKVHITYKDFVDPVAEMVDEYEALQDEYAESLHRCAFDPEKMARMKYLQETLMNRHTRQHTS